MALAAGKVEDVEETEAALLAAHGRKHGGQAASSAASVSSTFSSLPAASTINLEELILGGGRGVGKDLFDKRAFGYLLAPDTGIDLYWRPY